MFLTVFISDLDAQEELHYNLRALVGQLRFNFMSKLVAFPRACELLDLTSSLEKPTSFVVTCRRLIATKDTTVPLTKSKATVGGVIRRDGILL